ncbi:MAG: methyltransferase domain-containing protein [Chloroflexi bacterium]|nr:methyltransferase domain-containing protein [Chloroflexota bacterium]
MNRLLIFYVRAARRKAITVARAEALALLGSLDATAAPGGPLSERGGIFWISCPSGSVGAASTLLPFLGYTEAVDLLQPAGATLPDGVRSAPGVARKVQWRRETFELARLYSEDPEQARQEAPDRRVFLYEDSSGRVRPVQGYRGDGAATSRRGLPVCDARLLVNLVQPAPGSRFLDPFAGIGGLVREAAARRLSVFSIDIDPSLRHGLASMGSFHIVADARQLPFQDGYFEGAATEPPYSSETGSLVPEALAEMARVVCRGGRVAMLCAEWQTEAARETAVRLGLSAALDSPVNRKGLNVHLLVWTRW